MTVDPHFHTACSYISIMSDSFSICFFYLLRLDYLSSQCEVLKAWHWNGEDNLTKTATGMVNSRCTWREVRLKCLRKQARALNAGAREKCTNVDPLKSRHQDRIKPARHLLEETPVQDKGWGNMSKQIAMLFWHLWKKKEKKGQLCRKNFK